VLLGTVKGPSCSTLPATADCIDSDHDHDGGEVAFAPDGSIFLSTGDGGGYDDRIEPSALRAQDPDALAGKILHISPAGDGLPDNPWWNGSRRANRSKVWAVGFRNPFRIALEPGTSTLVAGDVGARRFEELDLVRKGGDYGWPCYEGPLRVKVYAKTTLCRALYARPAGSVQAPLLAIPHPSAQTIVVGTTEPAGWRSGSAPTLLFGDWTRGWIRSIRVGGHPAVSRDFASRVPGPVALHRGPDGRLYYLAIDSGDLRRLDVR
jgi:glucose/arabinose dehydrogenase